MTKPYKYELAYLESTGTQYIDTLWSPQSNNLRVKFRVQSNGTPRSTAICGAENSSIVPRWVFVMFGQSADDTKTFPLIGDWKNGGTGFAPEGFTFTDGTILDIDWTTSSTSTTITDSISNITYTHTFDTTITYSNNTTTLKLFQNGDAQKSSIDMYYYQIYDNGILVRDYIPVLDFNNIPAMYDKVTGQMFYNQGTGQFKYAIKPYKCEVEYLQSSGTQYIVSPVVFSGDNYRIECKYDKQALEQATMFGYQKAGSNGQQIMCIDYAPAANTKGDLFWHGSTSTTGNENRRKQNIFDIGLNEVVITANNNSLTYNINGNTATYSVVSAFNPQADTGMWIFGNSREAAAGGHQEATAKFYYLRVYQNNELKYDLIPVLDNNDVPCVCDRVSGQLYYNSGTGDFLYGRKIYPVEYLEGTGTQYIDTGYIPTNNTSFDLYGDMDYHAGTTRFGSRVNTLSENYCFTVINGDAFRFSYGTGQSTGTLQYIFETQKFAKQVSYDASTKICTIIFNDSTTESSTPFTSTSLTSSAKSLYLFAFNDNGSVVYGTSKQTELKIYESGVLVRDYIPAIDENGVGFMFDRVTHTIFDNAGTGEFLYGARITELGSPSLTLRRKLMMMLTRGKKKYKPLKYLESTSTGTYTSGQYIDTGLDYFADFEITAMQSESAGMKALGTLTTYCVERENATTNAWRFRNGESTFFTTSLLVTDLHTLKWKNGKVYGDGLELGSFAKTTGTNRMYLFGAATPTDLAKINRYPLRISSCKLWHPTTGELVRDFIPVLDSNNVPCMYDRVTEQFFYNQGTGDFLYEEWDFTPVDCVYANGNAYINTLCYGNSDTKMEMVFDITNQSTQNRGSMGSRGNSANSQLLAVGYGTSVLASDFNNSSYSPYRASITYNLNTKYRVYTSKEKRSITDEATGTVLDENNTLCTNNISTGALLLGAETGLSYRHIGNIYGAKIWDDETLIRDFIPVVDGDNKGCFYDKCLNIMFYSQGSSDFVGHFVENNVDYKVVQYITAEQVASSTNTKACPYIDTGLYPSTNAKTRLKCKASLSVATTSYEHYLGGTNAGSRFVVGQAGGSSGSKFYFGLGTQNFWTTLNVDTNTHIFELDWATETCSIDDTTWQIPSAGTSASTKPFFINARNTANNANANRPGGGDSYWWKFYEGNTLVYNGIAVVRTSDNKAGLFEAVNREFQTTAGTVDYTYTE